MEIRQYLKVLDRRKWVVILTTLATVMAVGAASYLQAPIYAAVATVRVAQATGQGMEYADYVYAERLMNTYSEVLMSRPFLAEVTERLDLDTPHAVLRDQIEVEVLLNTELLRITVEDQDPYQAQKIANVLASLLVEHSQSLYFGGEKSARELLQEQLLAFREDLDQDRQAFQDLLDSEITDQNEIDTLDMKIGLQEEFYANLLRRYEEARIVEASRANSVSLVELAALPERPSKPRVRLNMVLAAFVGLVLGIGLAFLWETLDTTLHSALELEAATQLRLLASMPWDRSLRGRRRVPGLLNPNEPSVASEAFRMLRTELLSLTAEESLKTFLVTSAEPGTGKSTMVANLAMFLANTARHTIVVDGDCRRPTLHKVFNLANDTGLSDVLAGRCSLEQAVQETELPGLLVLTSGMTPTDPAQLFGTSAMHRLLADLRERADVVLFDSPPILAVVDTLVLAPQVGGLLLVSARNQTTPDSLDRALREATAARARTLGMVFNRAQSSNEYYHHYAPTASRRLGPEGASTLVWLLGLLVALALVITVGSDLVMASNGGFLSAQQLAQTATREVPTLQAQATPQPTQTIVSPTKATTAMAPTKATVAQATEPTATPATVTRATPTTATQATPTPVAPKSGFIRFVSTDLYGDPNDPVSTILRLPANWPVQVLEESVPGFKDNGSDRWHRVRVMIKGQTFEGYVTDRIVEID